MNVPLESNGGSFTHRPDHGHAHLRHLWMQIARTSSARAYCLAASFAGTFVTARYLGPEGRGVVAAATGWVTLFAMFAGLSISHVIYFVATGRPEREWLPKTLTGVLSIIVTATLAGWLVAAVGVLVFPALVFQHLSGAVLLAAFVLLPFMMWNEAAGSFLVAIGSLEWMNLWQVVGATAGLAAIVVFVAGAGWGIAGALLAFGTFQVIPATATLGTMARRAHSLDLDFPVIRSLLSGGVRLHLNGIATFAIMQANVLLVNAFRPAAETGYYHLAMQLFSGIQMFSLSVGLVALGVVTRDGPDRAWVRQKRLLAQSCAIMAAITVAGIVLAPFIVRLVAGAAFMPAVPVLQILLLGLVGAHFSIVMSSQWIGRGMFLWLTLVSAGMGAASVLMNCVVIPRHGVIGSAWVTTAVCCSGFITNGMMAWWVNARPEAQLAEAASVNAFDAGHADE